MMEPAPACLDVVGAGAGEQYSSAGDFPRRSAVKQQAKLQKQLAAEFQEQLAGSIAALEARMQQGSDAQKARARERRLELRAVLRGVTESGASTEARLRLLQVHFTQLVQEQARHDAEVLTLQEQLAAATKEGEAAHRELAHALSKADSMAKLSRSLQERNKLLTKQVDEQTQAHASFQEKLQGIQAVIDRSSDARDSVLEHNGRLTEENVHLRSNLKELCEGLAQAQQQLQDVQADKAKQLEEQAALIESTRTHINCVAEQNKVLALKAEMAEQLQDTVSKLGALNAAYQERLEDANARLAEQGASISNACATIKSFSKLKAQWEADLGLLPRLMAERDALKQQLREQGCELKRLQQQKQRLEGLCRAMQQRGAGALPDAGGSGPLAVAAAAEPAAGGCSSGGAGVTSSSSSSSDEASAGVPPEVSQLVRAAIAAIVAAQQTET